MWVELIKDEYTLTEAMSLLSQEIPLNVLACESIIGMLYLCSAAPEELVQLTQQYHQRLFAAVFRDLDDSPSANIFSLIPSAVLSAARLRTMLNLSIFDIPSKISVLDIPFSEEAFRYINAKYLAHKLKKYFLMPSVEKNDAFLLIAGYDPKFWHSDLSKRLRATKTSHPDGRSVDHDITESCLNSLSRIVAFWDADSQYVYRHAMPLVNFIHFGLKSEIVIPWIEWAYRHHLLPRGVTGYIDQVDTLAIQDKKLAALQEENRRLLQENAEQQAYIHTLKTQIMHWKMSMHKIRMRNVRIKAKNSVPV